MDQGVETNITMREQGARSQISEHNHILKRTRNIPWKAFSFITLIRSLRNGDDNDNTTAIKMSVIG